MELFERYLQERCTEQEERELLELLETNEAAQQQFVRFSEEFALFATVCRKFEQTAELKPTHTAAPKWVAVAAAILIAVAAFLISQPRNTAPSYELRIEAEHSISTTQIEALNDGALALQFQVRPSDTSLILSRLNTDGSARWHRELNTPGRDLSTAMTSTRDGGALIAGTFRRDQLPTSGNMLLIRTHADGSTRWAKSWEGDGRERLDDVAELTDGTIIAAGFALPRTLGVNDRNELEIDGLPFDMPGYCSCIVYGMDRDGAVVWEFGFDPSTPNPSGLINYILPKIVPHPTGGFYLVGSTDGFGPGNSDAFAIRFTSSGQVLWERSFGTSIGELTMSATATADGTLWITGRHGDSDPNTHDETGFLLRVHEDGSLIDSRRIVNDRPIALASIVATQDAVYVGGRRHAPKPFDADGVILKFSLHGDLEWSHRYHAFTNDAIYNLTHTGSQVIASGETNVDEHTREISGWVFTVSPDGSSVAEQRDAEIQVEVLGIGAVTVEFPRVTPNLPQSDAQIENQTIELMIETNEKHE
jgi:hypothetical protein